MTDEEHQAQLDAVQAEISALAAAAFEELMQRLREGEAPREALAAVTATFHGEYAEALAREFSVVLKRTVSVEEIRALPLGALKLSDKLYRQASETSAVARTIIRNHLQGFQDARTLALKLYEGYQFHDDPLKVTAALPKYLREAMRDPAIDTGLRQLFARIRATNLKTPGLRAAYLQALDAIEKGAGEARLRKLLKIAWYERNRYFANRIAQTELHAAYEDQKALEFMADDSLHWVQVRMSKTHPRTDICDLHSKLDKYGMGPGVYPKAEAPKPTFHPFCRCILVPRWDLEGEGRARKHAERAFFEALPAGEARKVAGSHDRLQRILAGEDWEKVINGNADPLYRFRRVGEVIRYNGAMKEFKQPPGEFSIYDPEAPRGKPDVSTPLKRAVVKLEDSIRQQASETGAFFGSEGNVILQRSGKADKVAFTHGELRAMGGSTFTHNHPGGASFSLNDVQMAAEYSLQELRAVTSLFRHSMSGQWPAADVLDRAFAEELVKAKNAVHDLVITNQLHTSLKGLEIQHLAWVGVANRFGLIYRREKS
ncbi:structural protein [Methylococcus mesophilus]|uniref:hypothetical protein n=1 Tax=Methylococcus mesophilus TaxID=2993564 RepID=UPI00224AFFD8|nr:hypothetical protein [Methylococcus mesophilus]UZR29072.1 hypothetical protein OOT43_00165 [Methylococcus mesophilus]